MKNCENDKIETITTYLRRTSIMPNSELMPNTAIFEAETQPRAKRAGMGMGKWGCPVRKLLNYL